MELVKNVFFNTDKLTPNILIKISYIGRFFQDNSEKVYIHYGFDEEWKNTNDIEMVKTELGFQAEVQLLDNNTFNFCFKNEKNEWDNNDGKNFVFEIEHPNLSMILVKPEKNLSLRKKLRKYYFIKKKIKLSLYKFFVSIPKVVISNWKKKSKDNI